MLKNKRILFVILMVFLMILIPNVVKAEKIDISKIEISVPTPVVGKTPAVYEEVRVVADDNIELEAFEINWFVRDWENQSYTEIEPTEEFNDFDIYSVVVKYKRSFDYNVFDENGCVREDFKMFFNGSEIFGYEYDLQYPGTDEYVIDVIGYEFGCANKEKYISKVDVAVPVPELGKKQHGMESFSVKIDGSENFEVIGIGWEKYNSEKGEYEIDSIIFSDVLKSRLDDEEKEELPKYEPKDFQQGGRYRVIVVYKRPWEYGYSESLLAKINGETVDVETSFEFNDGDPLYTSEDGYVWDFATKEFSELKKYEPADDKDKENNKDSNLGTEAEKNKEETKKEEVKKEETKKEDPTKAGGTIPYTGGEVVIILSAVAIIGLGIYLYRKNKDLKGV